MNRFLLTICLAAAVTSGAMANSSAMPDKGLASSDKGNVPSGMDIVPSGMALATEFKAASRETTSGWGEWTDYTTGSLAYIYNYDYNIFFKEWMAGLGDQWVDFPEHFQIQMRENSENPDLVQYKFCDIFNHVDIIFDYDRATLYFSCQDQDTGIAISSPDEDGYTTYHFFMPPFYMFEMSKSFSGIDYYGPWFFTKPNYGYQMKEVFFQFDNGQNCRILPDKWDYYITSTETSTQVNLEIPENVTSYRVVYIDLEDDYDHDEFRKLWTPYPESSSMSYTDMTSPVLTVTPNSVWTGVRIIPLDEQGKAAAFYYSFDIYWNKPLEGEWLNIGTATVKENYWVFGIPYSDIDYNPVPFLDYPDDAPYDPVFIGEAPAIQQLPIEVSATNPAVYKITNLFGTSHPYYQYLRLLNPDEDFHIIIDASNPSQVEVIPTLTGFAQTGYVDQVPMMIETNTYSSTSGQLIDGKIKFDNTNLYHYPCQSWQNDLWQDFAFEIELPEQGGIDSVADDSLSTAGNQTAVWYNLQGQRVDTPANGVYIRVSGGKAEKVRIP